jgi:FlaA1/EpsC-like NDP-sugar epimerase
VTDGARAELFAGATLETLLGRPFRQIPLEEAKAVLGGSRILVTGAGGSVGSALVPALLTLQPASIIALDHHEAQLFALGRALPREAPVDLRLADIRNAPKLQRIMDEHQPHVVFHLAAYKHVPFGEREPDEPVSVNVLGTAAVVRAAVQAGVAHVAYPSSDKAVNPPSVYGATKRLAETLLQAQAARTSSTHISLIRYVNIMGSSGSVLETFAQQAAEGRPLTLTDPRMTRYWLAMPEAIGLLWQSLTQPTGSITLLDTGEPISVEAMGRRMFQLVKGRNEEPEIVVTGARPGERLAEELASASERLVHCGESPILRVVHSRADEQAARIDGMVEELSVLLERGAIGELRERVMELSRQLQ